jgi:hypothetical protein
MVTLGLEDSRCLGLLQLLGSLQMKVSRLSALHTECLQPSEDAPCTHFFWRLSRSQRRSVAGRIKPDLLVYLTQISNVLYQISWKSVHWEPRCYIRTDITNLIVALCNLTNAPKNRMAAILLRTKNVCVFGGAIFFLNIRCHTHFRTLKLRSCVCHVNATDR